MKVAFIARNDGTDVRQTKICNSLCDLGYQVAYIGWDRQPGNQKPVVLDPRIQRYVFEWPAAFGEISVNGWPQFLRYVANTLARIKPDVVHARDEPMATLVLPLKGILYRYLVLDIFDSLAARHFSSPFWGAAAWLTRKAAHIGCDRIIETSEQLRAMLGRYADKAIVIMNVPNDPGEEVARDYPTSPAVQICVGGSLARERDGLETLLKAVELLPPGEVQIQASGRLYDEYSRAIFAKHPAVNYRWFDTSDEFRRHAAKCDALTYLRGDASETEYRSWVLPNRVFDAMSIGRPIIVSRELKISTWIEEQQLGFVCDPGDPASLANILRLLKDRRKKLPEFAERVRRIFTSQYTWPLMERRLRALYEGLVG